MNFFTRLDNDAGTDPEVLFPRCLLLLAHVKKMKPSGAKTKQDVPSNWSPAVGSCLPPIGGACMQTHTHPLAHGSSLMMHIGIHALIKLS